MNDIPVLISGVYSDDGRASALHVVLRVKRLAFRGIYETVWL